MVRSCMRVHGLSSHLDAREHLYRRGEARHMKNNIKELYRICGIVVEEVAPI